MSIRGTITRRPTVRNVRECTICTAHVNSSRLYRPPAPPPAYIAATYALKSATAATVPDTVWLCPAKPASPKGRAGGGPPQAGE